MESRLLQTAILRLNNSLRPYPSLFYFPGIRSNPFWDSNEFRAIKILEENYSIIKQEFFEAKNNFNLENDYKMTDHDKSLHKGSWEWFSFISKGIKKDNFNTYFPKSNKILESIEDKMIDLPFAYCFFSRLSPNSSISPHYGPCNIRLRIHLGLDIPDNCTIKVGENEMKWQEGKCLIFDDTYIHEVHNKNENRFRTILLLDIWHPDIKVEEREAIVKMFKSAYEKGWLKK